MLRTCILFLPPSLELASCLSMVINSDGTMISPLETRDVSALKPLQKDTYTYLVLPAERANIYHLSLPHLSSKKAQTAIEFAIEPLLPQPLVQVHLTYAYEKDTQTYQVIVINKSTLHEVLNAVDTLRLRYNGVIIDASLLKTGEAFYDEARLVVYSKSYHGTILPEFEPIYESCLPDLVCTTNKTLPATSTEWMKLNHIDFPIQLWLAQRLIKNKLINLCHGDLSVSASQAPKKHYQVMAIGLFIAWVASYFISSTLMIYQNNHQLAKLDEQTETAFKQFFTDDKEMTNPRFRIEQLLKQTHGKSSGFWRLLTGLNKHPIDLESLSYKNQTMMINFKMKQFSELQTLENKLRGSGLRVKQTQARESGKEIDATLELKT
jgi:general secretion pathway protein L